MLILRIYSPNFGNVLKQRVFNEEVPIIFSTRIYRKATNLILQMLEYLYSFPIISHDYDGLNLLKPVLVILIH